MSKPTYEQLEQQLANMTAARNAWQETAKQFQADADTAKEQLAEARRLLKPLPRIFEWLEMDTYIKGYLSHEKDYMDEARAFLAPTGGADQ